MNTRIRSDSESWWLYPLAIEDVIWLDYWGGSIVESRDGDGLIRLDRKENKRQKEKKIYVKRAVRQKEMNGGGYWTQDGEGQKKKTELKLNPTAGDGRKGRNGDELTKSPRTESLRTYVGKSGEICDRIDSCSDHWK